MSSFPKSNRLLTRSDFTKLKESSRAMKRGPFLCFYKDYDSKTPPKLGLTITKKVGPAVLRNQIKRIARESFRHTKNALQGKNLNLVAARAFKKPMEKRIMRSLIDEIFLSIADTKRVR